MQTLGEILYICQILMYLFELPWCCLWCHLSRIYFDSLFCLFCCRNLLTQTYIVNKHDQQFVSPNHTQTKQPQPLIFHFTPSNMNCTSKSVRHKIRKSEKDSKQKHISMDLKYEALLEYVVEIRADILNYFKGHILDDRRRPYISLRDPLKFKTEHRELYEQAVARSIVPASVRDELVEHLCSNYTEYLCAQSSRVYARLQRLEDVMDFILQQYKTKCLHQETGEMARNS